jgi:hypothetical protein
LKLNDAQSRHLAASLRAYGLGQMAAYGYTGVQTGHWWTVAISIGILMVFEVGALVALKDVRDMT